MSYKEFYVKNMQQVFCMLVLLVSLFAVVWLISQNTQMNADSLPCTILR